MKNNIHSSRVLAHGCLMSNDTWATGLNNNDLIIGPSGAGKTRGYVKPNLLQCDESVIVTDTKGSLFGEVGPALRRRGYEVVNIDFTDMLSSYGYNPLRYIRYDAERGKYSEQDIMTIAKSLCPVECAKDPFWENSAAMLMASLVGYTLECLPKEEHTLESVSTLMMEMAPPNMGRGRSNTRKLIEELGVLRPDSFAYQKYKTLSTLAEAEKTWACILGFMAEQMNTLTYEGPIALYNSPHQLDFSDLGRRKMAVFLTVSDTDRSCDKLVNLFYTQALQTLCRSADKDYPDHRLPVPVRFILDDFATNTVIPDFDNIISVIRSREIYVSVIIQSVSQLNALYGADKASTIINNCDNCLYLGGQDVETARFISVRANRTADSILSLPLGEAYLFTRGQPPKRVRKFEIETHERYRDLPEAVAVTGQKAGIPPEAVAERR